MTSRAKPTPKSSFNWWMSFVRKYEMDTKAALVKVLRLISDDSAYAFVLIDKQEPDTLFVAKNKSPLLVGLADGYNMVGSDAFSMIKETNQFMEIDDHELVIVKPDNVAIPRLRR